MIIKYFAYNENNLNGIFNYFNHILQKKVFTITAISHENMQDSPYGVTYRNLTTPYYWCSKAGSPYMIFDFSFKIRPTAYSFGNADRGHTYPTALTLLGLNEKGEWIQIHSIDDLQFCDGTHCTETTFITPKINFSSSYKSIMIRSDHNTQGNDFILLSSFELFGEIIGQICTSQNIFNCRLFLSIFMYILFFE